MIPRSLLLSTLVLLLAGCDLAALLADPRVAQREADGKAIGGACRHALRGIEDCYALNEKAQKTAIFAGWKEMDQYMRENKIEGQVSKVGKVTAPPAEEEEIIEDKKPKVAANEKMAPDTKSKAGDAKTKAKPAEKAGPAKSQG